jgi:hypothetical protein
MRRSSSSIVAASGTAALYAGRPPDPSAAGTGRRRAGPPVTLQSYRVWMVTVDPVLGTYMPLATPA